MPCSICSWSDELRGMRPPSSDFENHSWQPMMWSKQRSLVACRPGANAAECPGKNELTLPGRYQPLRSALNPSLREEPARGWGGFEPRWPGPIPSPRRIPRSAYRSFRPVTESVDHRAISASSNTGGLPLPNVQRTKRPHG